MYTFNFEKLEIWKDSIELSTKIYKLTSSFEKEEKYGLVSQLRRASSSISTNIAEGSTRSTSKDRIRFVQIAFGSLMEVLSLLILSNKLEMIDNTKFTDIRNDIEKLANMLNAYKRAISK